MMECGTSDPSVIDKGIQDIQQRTLVTSDLSGKVSQTPSGISTANWDGFGKGANNRLECQLFACSPVKCHCDRSPVFSSHR
jgi:hypothetical protein